MDAQTLTAAFHHGCFAIARGEVFPSEQAEAPLAALTTLLSVKPGTSEVVHGPTTNNSYRIEWHDGSRSRMVFDPADAAIELFRNGDVEITENGVATRIPRTLPFAHDGYGQDAEWVAANFTNATEILAVGYPQWVDAQVGEGLTNGLYKFTAIFPYDPPETIELFVGYDGETCCSTIIESLLMTGSYGDEQLDIPSASVRGFSKSSNFSDDVLHVDVGAHAVERKESMR